MKTSVRPLFVSAAIAFCLTFTLAVFAQEKPAPAPEPAPVAPVPVVAETPPPVAANVEAPAVPAAPNSPAVKPSLVTDLTKGFAHGFADKAAEGEGASAAADPDKSTLRRLDTAPDTGAPAPVTKKKTVRVKASSGGDPDRVVIFSDNLIGAGEKVEGEAVAIMGDLRSTAKCGAMPWP